MRSVLFRVLFLSACVVGAGGLFLWWLQTAGPTAEPQAILGATGHAWDVVFRNPDWLGSRSERLQDPVVRWMLYVLYGIVALICVYAVRHYTFTFNRIMGRQRHPYVPLDEATWPHLTVVVPCHNEERVVETVLSALLRADYPADRLRIMPVNDRSTDRTKELIDQWANAHPGRIRPFHRMDGKPGKAAALKDALEYVEDDVMLVFDADYVPGRDLIKRLAAPFLDPEVGAVMGRVVPVNTASNLLTRMLDMERAGGYQVDQQARMNLGLIPQYGGTVGGIRVTALREVGGWRDDSLSEDTDITCRLAIGGWKIAYSNRYECYEEVPESWPVRIRQIKRWARGHTDAAMRYSVGVLRSPHLRVREKLDGVLLLGTYLMSPILLIGWVLALVVFYLGANPLLGALAVLSVASYNTIGNFAAFFEIGTAVRLDGTPSRLKLLPLVLSGFLVSLVSTSTAAFTQIRLRRSADHPVWDKTTRYRPDVERRTAPDRPAAPGTRFDPEPYPDRPVVTRKRVKSLYRAADRDPSEGRPTTQSFPNSTEAAP